MSINEINNKLSRSKLGPETKEIFSLLLGYFDNVLKAKNDHVKKLEDKVSTLENKVQTLENKLDVSDQYERRDTIIVSGEAVPLVSTNENCKGIVLQLFQEHLRINVAPADISISHRIGKKPTEGTDKRNLIIKFCRREIIPELYAACRQFKPPFYLNDSLTPTRSKICYLLRKLRRKYPDKIKGCRIYNGEPRVLTPSTEPRSTRQSSSSSNATRTIQTAIVTRYDLQKFVRDHLLSSFSNESITW